MTATTPAPSREAGPAGQPLALFGALAAVTAWGSAGIIIAHIELSSTEIAVYRFAAYGVLVAVFLGIRGNALSWRALRVSIWGGLALGLDVAFFFEAVKRTTIVNATIIGSMQPIVVTVIANRLYGETVSRRNVALAGVALVGVVGVVLGGTGGTELNWQGDLLAVGALFAWSGYFVFSKQTQDRVTPTEYTAATAVITALVNVAIGLAIGTSFRAPVGDEWFWMIVLTLAAGVVGHSIMNWALVRIPLWLGSVTTLFIPVTAAILAWILLDQPLDAVQIASIVVVIGALAGIILDQTRSTA